MRQTDRVKTMPGWWLHKYLQHLKQVNSRQQFGYFGNTAKFPKVNITLMGEAGGWAVDMCHEVAYLTISNGSAVYRLSGLVVQCCYDHQTFTATTVVSYHRTNTAIAMFYSVLSGFSGRCFLKTAPHFSSVISSLHERERTARSVGDDIILPSPARPLPHSQTTGLPGQQQQSRHCT